MEKSVGGFEDAGYSDEAAERFSTFCFFSGIVLTALLNASVRILGGCPEEVRRECDEAIKDERRNSSDAQCSTLDVEAAPRAQVCASNPSHKISSFKNFKERREADLKRIMEAEDEARLLRKVGLMSGLAIALHNFPEGIATFVSYLADPTAGVATAFAIALHNIPEGVVVAMPIYYATKSRYRGFFWAFVSGVSEPIGAVFAWITLSNVDDMAYAVMFGIVAGIMVFISVAELIPTALHFDPENKYATISVFVGMAVMAASILLFNA